MNYELGQSEIRFKLTKWKMIQGHLLYTYSLFFQTKIGICRRYSFHRGIYLLFFCIPSQVFEVKNGDLAGS